MRQIGNADLPVVFDIDGERAIIRAGTTLTEGLITVTASNVTVLFEQPIFLENYDRDTTIYNLWQQCDHAGFRRECRRKYQN